MTPASEGKRLSRCGRGVLKLSSFKPCPRPGRPCSETKAVQREEAKAIRKTTEVPVTNATNKNFSMNSDAGSRLVKDIRFRDQGQTSGTADSRLNMIIKDPAPSKDLPKVLVKFSYKANPDRPGGFDELTIKQGEKLYFHHPHKSNPHWVLAENMDGESGYVPGSYLMELKKQPTQLPWLENRRLEKEEEEEKLNQQKQRNKETPGGFGAPEEGTVQKSVKAYVSAYDTPVAASDYSCDLCGKSFNGPKPYRLHMASKLHKEEVENQKLMN